MSRNSPCVTAWTLVCEFVLAVFLMMNEVCKRKNDVGGDDLPAGWCCVKGMGERRRKEERLGEGIVNDWQGRAEIWGGW